MWNREIFLLAPFVYAAAIDHKLWMLSVLNVDKWK